MPELRFAFKLARELGKTVKWLMQNMDSDEFTFWVAIDTYFQPLADPWRQTSMQVSASLAPHLPADALPEKRDPTRFIPVKPAPLHPSQDLDALRKLRREWGLAD